jgi:hypothetical protein
MAATYVYLHGFASGPRSQKAQYLRSQFHHQGRTLQIPDLNQNDFAHLTLTRQIQQGYQLIQGDAPSILIGSSLGGLTAAWVAEQAHHRLQKLILLAPAFQFLNQWLPRLSPSQLEQWQTTGWLSLYHYAQQCSQPLHYNFLADARQYDEACLQRPIPTLILHGQRDDVIDIEVSRTYAQTRPWVTLQALETDHAMTDVKEQIWQAIYRFCLR